MHVSVSNVSIYHIIMVTCFIIILYTFITVSLVRESALVAS